MVWKPSMLTLKLLSLLKNRLRFKETKKCFPIKAYCRLQERAHHATLLGSKSFIYNFLGFVQIFRIAIFLCITFAGCRGEILLKTSLSQVFSKSLAKTYETAPCMGKSKKPNNWNFCTFLSSAIYYSSPFML